MKQLWMRQITGVMSLELRRTALSKRGWWIYLLALGPVALAVLHWLVELARHGGHHSVGDDSMVFAGMFMLFFLRGSIFFGAMGIFSNLYRGEMLEKTLHYYYLTPIRREALVVGKYLSGLAVSLVLFTLSTALTFLLMGRHFGAAWSDYLSNGPGYSQLGSYVLVTALACVGYGAVFLVSGLIFKNPLGATAAVWVWEGLNPFLPDFLKKISIIYYLKSLLPVEVPLDPPFNVLAVETDPASIWVAVPGVLAVSLILLAYAAVTARQSQINYGE